MVNDRLPATVQRRRDPGSRQRTNLVVRERCETPKVHRHLPRKVPIFGGRTGKGGARGESGGGHVLEIKNQEISGRCNAHASSIQARRTEHTKNPADFLRKSMREGIVTCIHTTQLHGFREGEFASCSYLLHGKGLSMSLSLFRNNLDSEASARQVKHWNMK